MTLLQGQPAGGTACDGTARDSAGPGPALAGRVQALEAVHREIARSRMQGLPLLHPGLQVQAVGFQAWPAAPDWALGVLVTPWFMNLVRLPLQPVAATPSAERTAQPPGPGAAPAWLALGATATRELAGQRLDFIGAHETGLGAFEAASLFSPMFEFADQAAAVATAQAVLHLLREPVPAGAARSAATVAPALAPASTLVSTSASPSTSTSAGNAANTKACLSASTPASERPGPARRGFLFGRAAEARP